MTKNPQKPNAFLITPIGTADSPERIRVSQWMKLIYKPVLKDRYNIIRSDLIAVPWKITQQIIDYVCDADLVIIDYTPSKDSQIPNPNVMYEAAIRHIARKATIQIAPESLHLPFDIKDFRCIIYDPSNLNYPKQLKKELKINIDAVNAPDYKPADIIGHTYDLERIVSDPEKFIMLLKKYLIPDNSGTLRLDEYLPTLRGMYGPTGPTGPSGYSGSMLKGDTGAWSIGASGSASIPTNKPVSCPVCGSPGILSSNANGIPVFAGMNQQYWCPNCGRSFIDSEY